MSEADDTELLRDYARQHSDTAFTELVRRHVALVYSAAFRHTGRATQAEEITQAVFIILARKAAGLRPEVVLEGWLYETTRLTALSFLRGERRRQFREQEAYMQVTGQENHDDAVWTQVDPLLDEAMARLGNKDRDAVVLRFFKGKEVCEVAKTLHASEAATYKRVSRGLEKLRKYFLSQGVNSTSSAIAKAIAARSISAAPVGLANSISVAALAGGPTASASTLTLVKGTLKIMAWTKTKTAVLSSVVAILAVTSTGLIGIRISHGHRPVDARLGHIVQFANPQASVQDIVQSLAQQAGLSYDWQKSHDQTDPVCRQWVRDVNIEGKPCTEALDQILKPVGLHYHVDKGVLSLSR